jgi:hypothetical protein
MRRFNNTCFSHALLIVLLKNFTFHMIKKYMSLLHVSFIKFLTNEFIRNFSSYIYISARVEAKNVDSQDSGKP